MKEPVIQGRGVTLSRQPGMSGEAALQEAGEGLGVTHPALGDRGESCPTAWR